MRAFYHTPEGARKAREHANAMKGRKMDDATRTKIARTVKRYHKRKQMSRMMFEAITIAQSLDDTTNDANNVRESDNFLIDSFTDERVKKFWIKTWPTTQKQTRREEQCIVKAREIRLANDAAHVLANVQRAELALPPPVPMPPTRGRLLDPKTYVGRAARLWAYEEARRAVQKTNLKQRRKRHSGGDDNDDDDDDDNSAPVRVEQVVKALCSRYPSEEKTFKKMFRKPKENNKGVVSYRMVYPLKKQFQVFEIDIQTGKRVYIGTFDKADDAERERAWWAESHLEEHEEIVNEARRQLKLLRKPIEDTLPMMPTTNAVAGSMLKAERAAGPILDELLEQAVDTMTSAQVSPGIRGAQHELSRWRAEDPQQYTDALELAGGSFARHRRAWERAIPALAVPPSCVGSDIVTESATADRLARWALRGGAKQLISAGGAAAYSQEIGAAVRASGIRAPTQAAVIVHKADGAEVDPDVDAAWSLAMHPALATMPIRVVYRALAAASLAEHAAGKLDALVIDTVSQSAATARTWRHRSQMLRTASVLATSPIAAESYAKHMEDRLMSLTAALRKAVPELSPDVTQASAAMLLLSAPSQRLVDRGADADANLANLASLAIRGARSKLGLDSIEVSAIVALGNSWRAMLAWSSSDANPPPLGMLQRCTLMDVLVTAPCAALTSSSDAEAAVAALEAVGGVGAAELALARAPQLLAPAHARHIRDRLDAIEAIYHGAGALTVSSCAELLTLPTPAVSQAYATLCYACESLANPSDVARGVADEPASLLAALRLGGTCASRPDLHRAVRSCALLRTIRAVDVVSYVVGYDCERRRELL